jgi:uncharacterized membrane protein SirB2
MRNTRSLLKNTGDNLISNASYFQYFNITVKFVTVLHALKYNNSSNTMQRLTRYLTYIEDTFITSGTIGMASTSFSASLTTRLFFPFALT